MKTPLLALLCLPFALACSDDAPPANAGAAGAGGALVSGGAGGAGGTSLGGAAGASGSSNTGAAGAASAPGDEGACRASVLASGWVELENAPKLTGGGKQDDVFFLDTEHGFAVSGEASAVYETKDGGATWATILEQPGSYFRSVVFTSPEHGFVGNLGAMGGGLTDTNVMYETLDGGATWAPVTNITGPAPKGICNFDRIDDQHLVAVGRVSGPSVLLKTDDGGSTWTSHDLSKRLSMLIDAHFTSPTEGVVVGGSYLLPMACTVLRTTDGGESWERVFVSETNNSLCWKVNFPSPKVGYVAVQDAGSGDPTFAKTTDGGATWEELPLPGGVPFSGIGVGFVTDDIGWLAAEDSKLPVYRTVDGGKTWDEDPSIKAPINRFRFVDRYTGYASGGSFWKLTLPRPLPTTTRSPAEPAYLFAGRDDNERIFRIRNTALTWGRSAAGSPLLVKLPSKP